MPRATRSGRGRPGRGHQHHRVAGTQGPVGAGSRQASDRSLGACRDRALWGVPASLDSVATALVIENDPTDDLRRLGEWLTEAGLELPVSARTPATALPGDLDGYAALVVLGGDQHAYPGRTAAPARPGSRSWRRCCARRSGPRAHAGDLPRRAAARPGARRHGRAQPVRPGDRVRRWSPGVTPPSDDPLFGACRSRPTSSSGTPTRSPNCRSGRPCSPPPPATRTRRSASATGPGACSSTSSATPRCRRVGANDADGLTELGRDPDALVAAATRRHGRRRARCGSRSRRASPARARRTRRRQPAPQPAAARGLTVTRAGPAGAWPATDSPRATAPPAPRDLLGPDGLALWQPDTQEPADERAAELLAALSRAADPDPGPASAAPAGRVRAALRRRGGRTRRPVPPTPGCAAG